VDELLQPVVERLAARAAIADALARFARGVDRRDWELARSAFHDDAIDDHGDHKGPIGAVIDAIAARHSSIESSAHFICNCLMEFVDADTAIVETYIMVIQSSGAGDGPLQHTAARYVDRFERRARAWKIAQRVVVPGASWQTISQELVGNWVAARRDGLDPTDLATPHSLGDSVLTDI
jgi:hypothetical protein